MIHRHVTARHARRFRYAMPPAIQKRTLVRSVLGGWWTHLIKLRAVSWISKNQALLAYANPSRPLRGATRER